MAPQGPFGAAESSRHVVLIGPTLFDEAHHRVGLGHVIAYGVLREDHAGSENHTVALLGSDQAAVVDDHGARRRRDRREKIVLSERVRHGADGTHGAEKADRFGSEVRPGPPPPISEEKASGYVRRSGIGE